MAEPRKVQFVTLSAFAAGPATESRKRRLDDEADINFDGDLGIGKSTTGAGGGGGLFGKTGDTDGVEPNRATVRLNLSLTEPNDQSSAEFNYSELIQSLQKKKTQKTQKPTPTLDPNDPFNDDERERQEVEALAKKFENKYGGNGKKKRKDRMQDLIDIGFGYDESDPFIDNSEAYDELVPASLTTKLGGFYINTGTLQFRAASESEGEEEGKVGTPGAGEVQMIRKRKRKEGIILEEKKPRKNRVPKQGVTPLNLHRPEKKKRKKLMKDSLYLAAMLRRFTREKEDMRRKNAVAAPHLGLANASNANHMLHNSGLPGNSSAVAAVNNNNDISLADLTADPAMMSLLSSANESELQDLLGDLDFSLLDPGPLTSIPGPGRENGLMGVGVSLGPKAGQGRGQGGLGVGGGLLSPPPLPAGLPAPLTKRIEDLRAASRQFDQEGRKKFFTLDMNDILLDIELQVQEQPTDVRSAIYSHMEAFVPCNKEALLKRLKKLSLNIQDDRLRTPLLKLKLAVCSVMPEQIARYNMDCVAKAAAKQSEEGEKNGSEEEDEEKPGKRVMGPRKKFFWDDKLRTLLCNLVRVKLSCYEQEPQGSLSVEDYLKAFMENEVKPLWPKGWMQARMLFKESRSVHGHLTGLGKKRVVPGPKAIKAKEGVWIPRPGPVGVSPVPSSAPLVRRPPASPSEPICLSDSLDEDLATNSLDSISQALALLSNAAKGLTHNNGPPPAASSPSPASMAVSTPGLPVGHFASPLSHSLPTKLDSAVMSLANMSTLTTSPSLSSSSSSPAPARTPTITSSPGTSSRGETYGLLKDGGVLSQVAQRHSMTPTHRSGVGLNSPSPPKPRPPPTASPLLPPQQKPFCPPGLKPGQATPPPGPSKSSTSKAAGGNGGGAGGVSGGGSQQGRVNSHPSQLNPKSPQQPPRVPGSPSPVPSSPTSSHPAPKAPHPHPQSNFITPMQATLTKSSHSSSSAIIKLTPRPPAPTPPPSSSPSPSSSSSASSSPSSLSHSRPQMLGNSHQYSAKASGFRPPFTAQGGSSVKAAQGIYSFAAGAQKPSTTLSGAGGNANANVIAISSPIGTPPSGSSQQDGSPSPSGITANHGQRQRTVGGSGQSAKAGTSRASASTLPSPPATSHLSQVSSAAAGTNLLGSVPPSLPLGFGMLGGLVPVSLPFQFPPLLNFTPPSAPGSLGTSPGTNSGYTTLAQNLFKSLQSGSQAALPPHLQLAFSDTNQSQGGDVKRKSH